MSRPNRTACVACVVAVVTGGVVIAQEVAGPHAVVTALTGGGATHGADGQPFPTEAWNVYTNDFVLQPATGPRRPGEPEQSIVTAADGQAVLLLAGFGTVLELGDASAPAELRLHQPAGFENQIPLAPALYRGQVLVISRPDDDRWLLVSADGPGGRAYALSRGASFVVRIEADAVVFSVSQGEVIFFAGAPADRLIDEAGSVVVPGGVPIAPGQRLSTAAAQAAPGDPNTVARAVQQMDDALFALGLNQGNQWVEKAEQGDLTPSRGTVREISTLFAQQVGVGRTTFDQPRSIVVVSTPRATRTGSDSLRRQPIVQQSIANSLIRTGNPGSVVVGQRLRRTRIIGNPGSGGGPGANPRVEQLIKLPGR